MKVFCSTPKFVQNFIGASQTPFTRIVSSNVQCTFVPLQARTFGVRVPPARTEKQRVLRYKTRTEFEKQIKESNAKPLTPSQLAMLPEKQPFQKFFDPAPLRLMKPLNETPLRAPLLKDVSVPVVNFSGETVKQITIPKEIFLAPIRTDLIHRCVIWQLACARKGLAKGKTRAEVSGGGRKPHKQKGMGMARAGSTRAPNWRHGGRAFPKIPRSFAFVLPAQVRSFGLRSVLSAKFAQQKLVFLDSTALSSHKTKELSNLITKNQWESALIIDGETVSQNLELASSSIKTLGTLPCGDINVYKILKYDVLVLSLDCVKYLETVYFKDLLEGKEATVL